MRFSFSSRTKPSSAIFSATSDASFVVASETEPLPVASEIRVDMGPKQIMLTVTMTARIAAIQASLRMRLLKGFFSLPTAIVTMSASASAAPMAMK